MDPKRPTIVCITGHSVLRDMFERHGNRFAKMVCFTDFSEFERRALQLRPSVVIFDAVNIDDILKEVKALRKHPAHRAIRILVLCEHLSHDHRVLLHEAGVDDILLTTHFTPRDVIARLQSSL